MNKTKDTNTACILCSNGSFTKQFNKSGWDIVRCDSCGLEFVYPLPTERVVDDYYNKHKQSSKVRIATYLKTRVSRNRRDQRKLKLLEGIQGNKGRILDIGCGMGLFVKNASDRGWTAEGIDLDKEMIEYGKNAFGVNLSCTDLNDFRLPDGYFDAITMFNLLDHLRRPLDFLKEVERILKPNGIIYMNLHDAGGWKAKTYRENWGAYCPPGHLYYYTLDTLEALVNKAGLKFLMVPGVNLKEGIKMILAKKDTPRQISKFRKKIEKYVYACVQTLKL
ncbi:MAG: class I SAM-dependent methyltransferase [Candidatus Omnitrophota bacterium]|jgi:SAM-dependent methyltransferase